MRPLVFAHRGGRWLARGNTLRAFRHALATGAAGIESDVWLTADGVPVLSHGGKTLLGRPFRELPRERLPRQVPTLADAYARLGSGFDLSLDVKDRDAVHATLDVARAAGADPSRLWLCTGSATAAVAWRELGDGFRLVHSVERPPADVEAHAARLAAAGVDALNAKAVAWTPAAVEACRAAGLLVLGWQVLTRRALARAAALGLAAVYTDWPWLWRPEPAGPLPDDHAARALVPQVGNGRELHDRR